MLPWLFPIKWWVGGSPFKIRAIFVRGRGAPGLVTGLWYTLCTRFLWPGLRYICIHSAMGHSIWNFFPALVELYLTSDIQFSTGGATGMSFCSFALRMTIYFLSFHALVEIYWAWKIESLYQMWEVVLHFGIGTFCAWLLAFYFPLAISWE